MNPAAPDAGPVRVGAVVGPTASGKTAFALALAAAGLPIEAICCDASQLVAGLDAATAKPTAAERATLPHHLVDSVAIDEAVNAGRFAELATAVAEAVTARGRWPLLVGGTGLYHRALCEGLADIPRSPPALRGALEAELVARGVEAMHRELAGVDPDYAAATPPTNRQRVLRALEVYRATGTPFSVWHRVRPAVPRVRCRTIVLQPDAARHRAQLDARAAAMVAPLLAEVRALVAAGVSRQAPGLAALGYRDAWDFVVAGKDSDAAATAAFAERLAAAHRLYAKRQRTWFRKCPDALVVDAADAGAISVAAAALRAHLQP